MSGPNSPGGRWNRIIRAMDFAELAVANTASVVILATIAWNVVSRYALRIPVSWAEDVTGIAFAWFIFIGAAAVHNRRGHIGVDLLTALLPERARAFVDKAGELFVFVFCVYAAYLCGEQTIVSHAISRTTVLEIPLSALFASLSLGFALMAVSSALHVAGVRTAADEA